MKANMGSFGAALKGKNVWVMNVVPEDGPNTLKLIYDRGLIGTTHNWYAQINLVNLHNFGVKYLTYFSTVKAHKFILCLLSLHVWSPVFAYYTTIGLFRMK